MPQDALDNPLVLPMLGLLAESPRHQYALLRELRERYPFLRVKTSTVYTLVRSLERHGLVVLDTAALDTAALDTAALDTAALDTAALDTAERPQASLTPAGLGELRDRVERQLLDADPSVDPRFMIALAYLGVLAPAEASGLLRRRADGLRSQLRTVNEALGRPGLRELHMIETHFLASRLEHDTAWLTRLADRVDAGELDWPQVS